MIQLPKWMLLITLAFLSMTCAAEDPVIKIGTLIFNPPFETSNLKQKTFSGFEMDLMTNACQRSHLKCQFVPLPTLNDVFLKLAQHEFDLVVASVIILKGDGDHVFSVPYLPSGILFFTKKNSPITHISQIPKQHIGTTNDPLIQTLVDANYATTYPLQVYDSPQAGIDALNVGDIDVFVMQTANTKYWLQNTGDVFKAIGRPIPLGLGNGAIALASSAGLMQKINQALLDMQQDGTYATIYNRYNLQ